MQMLLPARAQSCTFTLGSTAQNFAGGGGQGSLRVTASQPACNWTATSNAPWITVTAGASGAGSGSVSYSVALNPTSAPRNGSLTVAGQIFTVNQSANLVGLQFFPLPAPVRLLETRAGFSGCTTPGAAISTNSTFTLPARTACAGVPATAAAVTGNVTVVPSAPGFLTLFPSDAAQPTVANSNFAANEITNNLFTVGLGATGPDAGAFKIFASATTHVIVDVTGYYAPPNVGGLYFHSLPAPVRLLETRAGFSGCFAPGAPLIGTGNPNADPNLDLAVQGRSPIPLPCNSIPASAQMLVGNATSVLPSGGGFLTIYPSGGTRPLIASSNYAGSDVINGPFTVRLGADGKFKIYTLATTHLVVDILGYYSEEAVDANGAGLLFTPLPAPVRLLETRADFPNFPLPGCTRTNAPIQGNLNAATHTQQARSFCGLPASAQAVVGNVTAVNTAGAGFLTLFPGNLTNAPLVATSNYPAPASFGYNRHYFVGLSPGDGTFKVLTQFTTELVVDVSGYFAAAPANQAPLVAAGADQTISLPTLTASLTGAASDDGLPSGALSLNWSRVSGAGTVMFSAPNQAATDATFSGTGVYVLRLTASDGALSASDDVQVTVNPPLSVNAGADQVVTLPNTTMMTGGVTGGSGAATLEWSRLSGPGSVIFSNAGATVTTAMVGINGVYVLRLTATDGQTMVSDDVQVTVNADPTPPPVLNAPPLDMTVATTLATATEFLYSGANAVQTGVAAGTIKPERAAVLRGRVLDKSNQPLPLVKVSVLNHPEYGQTLSRADGRFDLAVNGGGVLTVAYEKIGYLTAQRQENVPWQDYCGVPDVVLIGYDANVTLIDLSANAPMQIAQGGAMTDAEGARRARLLFAQGTAATMKLSGGAMAGLNKLSVRATEFTVGTNGPETMPAGLPPTSAYTYAAEFSVDEAVAAGATETTFNQPVIQYNENFLNFPVGTAIPSGSYDTQQGVWVPSANGRVVKILSINAGAANLDVNGAGQPATDPEYAALGISIAERQTLATLYAVNQSLWRVPHMHFSTVDANWPGGPIGAVPTPNGGTAKNNNAPPKNQDKDPCGSVIGCQGQTLSETVNLVGSRFTLNYSSDRVPGRQAEYTISIPLSGATVPASLQRIDLEVSVAGQIFRQSFSPTANQTTTFTWDGKDAYGRTVQGNQQATVTVGFVYNGVYYNTVGFGFSGNGVPLNSNPMRREVTLLRPMPVTVGAFDARGQRLGGWTLSAHHVYDPVGKTLYLGTGERRIAEKLYPSITTVAGSGVAGFSGDGGQALQARLNRPWGVGVGADGSLYIADTLNNRIRKVAPDGVMTTFAGTGAGGFGGDGGQATAALLNFPSRAQVGPEGSVYIDDRLNNRVRRVSPSGVIATFAGTGVAGFSGDGGPATQAMLNQDPDPFPFRDGSVYITDIVNHRVRRVMPDGIIRTIAGNGTAGFSGDGGPATQASLNLPVDLALQADGTVYISDLVNNRIRRVGLDGLITTVAGGGASTGDGIQATQAALRLDTGCDMALAPDGAVYFTERIFHRVRRLGTDGILTTVAGNGTAGFSGDGGPATQAQLNTPFGLGIARDGSLYIGDSLNHRIRRVGAALPGFSATDIAIPSEDGSELYQFDKNGRHLRTLNALTGATLLTFTYNAAGLLTQISDTENNVTTIQRDGAGNPTAIIAPFGQQTTLALNADGFLSQATDPANQAYQMTYTSGGLLTGFTDPRNNTSVMIYDAQGRLMKDTDAATGLTTLARADAAGGYTVTQTSALNRTQTKQVENLSTGEERRTNTDEGGLQTVTLRGSDEKRTITRPDGTVSTAIDGPDPRFGNQAPLAKSLSIRLPSGLTLNRTVARTVTLADPTNLLSLTSETTTTSVNGRNFVTNYTAANRTFTYTSPLNRQATTVIDALGRPAQSQTANFNATTFSYDARGRLASATGGTGLEARTATLAYDADGLPASVTDPLNRVRGLIYDLAGRITQQTLPGGATVAYGYDANGNLTSFTPPSRPAHNFAYSPVNLPTSYTAPNAGAGNQTTFAYNLDRQLISITRPDNLLLSYAYDGTGRLSTLTTPSGQYNYSYNPISGYLAGITAPGGGTLAFTYDGALLLRTVWGGAVAGNVSHTYNNNFLVASQSVNDANTVNFQYDNDGLLTGAGGLTLTRHALNGLLTGDSLSNVAGNWSYNGFGEVTSHNALFNGAPLYAADYTRDKLGRISRKTETIGGATNIYDYGHDAAGRLSTVTLNDAPAPAVTYSYDGNGNRTARTFNGTPTNATYDAQDRLLQSGSANYSYTDNGELQSKTVGAQTTQYQYDVLGNLRAVTLPDSTQIEYLIDGQDRRIGKKTNGALMQGFLYQDALNPVAELDGSNNVVSRFVYAGRNNVPAFMTKGGATYRIIADHLGSPRLIVNVATGVIAQQLDYDEFGNVIQDTNPGFQPFGFAGGLYDSQTKLTRFGARDYDAETGRWTAKDPLLAAGRDSNFYAYAHNDPVNLIDPNGQNPLELFEPFEKIHLLESTCEQLERQLRRAQRLEELAEIRRKDLEKHKASLCKTKNGRERYERQRESLEIELQAQKKTVEFIEAEARSLNCTGVLNGSKELEEKLNRALPRDPRPGIQRGFDNAAGKLGPGAFNN
ncbi:MAG TPA: RHS repeat-associated core domain-containing protein [Blastocatellia bacterium]|nr:RHS repeat-associated core domain-containing protein [Blastocatellia bacterium]